MDAAKKYLVDYFKFQLSRVLAAQKNYEEWRTKNYSLKTVEIKNKTLAKELEDACRKNGGFLTYAEHLLIDQFGKNGYHATHKDHGITGAHHHWGKAIATLASEKGIKNVIEFGPGAGDLAIEILKACRKNSYQIAWHGVELNPDLQNEIRTKFKKKGFEKNLRELVSFLAALKTKKQSIIVFSYSLDSLPPEIFLNSSRGKNYPDSLVGINVKDGVLSERILDSNMLKTRGITLDSGVYKEAGGFSLDLSAWKLAPGQRAYVPVSAFSTLYEFAIRFPDSTFVIIDEFQPAPYFWETRHLGVPKDLYRFRREIDNLEEGYRQAGSNLLYYQIYFLTFYKFLNALGFNSIKYEIEQKMAKDMVSEHWVSIRTFLTYAFIASDKRKTGHVFPLELPRMKLI